MLDALDYMRGIRLLRRRIKLLEEQIERDTILAAGVSAIRYDKDRVQTSPIQDRMTEIVAKIIETTDKLKESIYDLQVKEEEVIGYLTQIDEQYERILTYHYLDGIDWTEVADLMRYENSRYVYEVRDKALQALDVVLKENKNN